VAYSEDVAQARSVIRDAVEQCESVSENNDIQVFARDFGSSSIDFEVCWWSGSTPLEQRQSRDEVLESIKKSLDDAGIEIPFPYRTLTFKGSVPVDVAGPGESDSP
jgi:small conductance mechanosensitive channel